MNDPIKNYLNARGITDEVIEKAQLSMTQGKIVIPVFDKDGNRIFNKYRRDPLLKDDASIPKYTYDQGSKAALYNINNVDLSMPVFITEGEFDCLCLMSHGFQAISSTGGSGTFLAEWADVLKDCPDIVVCYDRDVAGMNGMLKVQSVLPKARLLFLPEFKGKDVTDYMLQFPSSNFLKLKAESWVIPEPDLKGSKEKQIRAYNDIANRALEFQRHHDGIEAYTHHIIERALLCRQEVKAYRKKVLNVGHNSPLENDRMKRAKEVPIHTLMRFNSSGFAKCIWHEDKTPSLKYYPKDNKVHCFGGCGKQWDAVDVVKQQEGCSTSEAIKILLN